MTSVEPLTLKVKPTFKIHQNGTYFKGYLHIMVTLYGQKNGIFSYIPQIQENK
jgi:hypothetical protein